MLGFFIYVFFSVCLIKVSAAGPMCFECSHISHARYCTNYVQCSDDEVCHVQKFITHNLHVQYSSGCVRNQTCDALKEKRFLDSGFNGLATCFECCHGDMCNNKGCGDHGPPPRDSRGPYCFQCRHLSDPRECEQVTICLENEVCGVDESAIGITETEYFSGCKRKMECLSPDGIFGRDLEHKRDGYNFCHQCCDGDFCNMDCVKTNISAEKGEWGLWSSWTNCSNNGEKVRTRDCIGSKTHALLNNCDGDAREETNCTLIALDGILDCDFEVDLCSWSQNNDDDLDWTRNSGNTTSVGTGPESDHTYGTEKGYYIYIEASGMMRKHDPAGLSSITINSTDDLCLRFWYSMHGYEMGSLTVYMVKGNQQTLVWERNGEQGQKWNLGSVTIQENQPYHIMFVGSVDGMIGDIGLDDISATQGPC